MCKRCKCCGNHYVLEDFDMSGEPSIRMLKGLCFSCAHWDHNYEMDKHERLARGIPLVVIDNSKGYSRRAHWFLPFYNFKGDNLNVSIHPLDRFQPAYRILLKDGRLFTVDNLYHQGTIPVHWHDKFKINACFLDTVETLSLITRRDTKVSEDLTHYIVSEISLRNYF